MRLLALLVTVSLLVVAAPSVTDRSPMQEPRSDAATVVPMRTDPALRVNLRGLAGHRTKLTLKSLQRPRVRKQRRAGRTVTFRHLRAGRYRLKVKAVDTGEQLLRPRKASKKVRVGSRSRTRSFRFERLDRMVLNQSFATEAREPLLTGDPKWYYARTTPFPKAPSAWPLPLDADGVVVTRRIDGIHNHPVSQAQYGLAALASYDLTKDNDYLTMARAQANRLLQTRREAGGAYYFPYTFRWRLDVTGHRYKPDWYSAMAQGQALSLFLKLAEVTGEVQWRDAADHIFRSLLRRPVVAEDVAVVHVHEGHLWLEEYPRYPVADSGHVYNGLMFATFGVYDYYLATGNPEAELLLSGVLRTIKDVFPKIRNPGGLSHYSIHRNRPHEVYHDIHIRQLRYLSEITGDAEFSRMSATLQKDH